MRAIKTWDWINNSKLWDNYIKIGNNDVHQLKIPKSINEKYIQIFIQNQIQVNNPYFLVSLDNPVVSCFSNGISGISIKTNNGIYLNDINPYWSESISKNNDIIFSTDSTCLLVSNKWGGYNYFHYIHTCLPKLSFYRRNITDENYKIIVNSFSVFVLESLSLLNYNIEDMLSFSVYPKIKPKILKAVSSIGYGVNPNKESCSLVRSLFKHYFLLGKKRLYISRSKANSRRVLNEDKIINLLVPFGFEIVNSENLSFYDQMSLFSQAEIVISAHGAGLSNIVFCNPGTKVLELQSPTYLGLCYWLIADSCDLDYYYLLGKGYYENNAYYYWKDGTTDIDIDINELKQTLEMMEIL